MHGLLTISCSLVFAFVWTLQIVLFKLKLSIILFTISIIALVNYSFVSCLQVCLCILFLRLCIANLLGSQYALQQFAVVLMVVLLVWHCTCHEFFLMLVLLRRVRPVYLVLLNVYALNNCGPSNFCSSILGKHIHLVLLDQSWFLARMMDPGLCMRRRVLRFNHYRTLQIYLGKLSLRFIRISLGMKRCMSLASLDWGRFNFKIANRQMGICNCLLDCLVLYIPFVTYYFVIPNVVILRTVSFLLRLSKRRI